MSLFLAGILIGAGVALGAWAVARILYRVESWWQSGRDFELIETLHRMHERGDG